METPKKPAKKTSASTGPAKKGTDKAASAKPKNKFIDDDDDDEFDEPIDDLGSYDRFDGLEEEEDF
ncbi:hypothetical protein [Mucilaginibacter paludis]|uniref:Uncharacterized protein n=1 Tax=Mucilaginibacter paludis DSM 18603 TaxID=714943 RepID=H1Y5F6_9SPHI|nr:hypothetical protein [Mucilaginibacter paludis]EHQ29308.1 hypothetical protein Mucpa_5233 [Mucilaginibacter paludis DSM 18603]